MQRKHTTTACQICRESKIKCDGARPTCGSCKRKGRNCEYSTKDDKRKISLRSAVELLSRRVQELTQLAYKNNIDVPPMSADEQSLLEQVCETLELPILPISRPEQEHPGLLSAPPAAPNESISNTESFTMLTAQSVGNAPPVDAWDPNLSTDLDMQHMTGFFTGESSWDESPSDWLWNNFSALPPYTIDPPLPAPPTSQLDQNGSENTSEDEVEADIAPRLAARFGSLRVSSDGQLRYYGSASNYHFLSNFQQTDPRIDVDDIQRAARSALENAQLDEDPPEALENHLLDLYFTWHNPSHSTVDRAMFENNRAQDSDDQQAYCSQSLVNAMCAIGAAFEGRYHQSFVTFPKPLADYFAARSKIFLEFEFDSPCVSTVQALLLLSSHEAASGRDARMWLYSGMAMRLSFDIGLHVDSSPYVIQGLLSEEEARARGTTFWSCVVVNQLWSFSLGRPFRVDSEEITVPQPNPSLSSRSQDVQTNQRMGLVTVSNATTSHSNNDPASLITGQWVSLCDALAPLIRVLYGCVTISKASLQALSYSVTTRLEKWRQTIPDIIKIHDDTVPSPQVMLLHMGYLNFCILIHRPWTSKNSQPDGLVGPGHHHARGICQKSASEIASLLRRYELHYGFRKMNVYVINIIFSASLILIFGLIAEEILGDRHDQEQKNVANDLNTCFRALDELGQSFESAKRNYEQLLAIQRHWSQRKRDARAGVKRKNHQQVSPSSNSKRSRSSRVSRPSTNSTGIALT